MAITHQTVVDSDGKPTWALIPWDDFVRFQEFIEIESHISAEEAEAVREAEEDRKAGNRNAFTDLATLKAELSL